MNRAQKRQLMFYTYFRDREMSVFSLFFFNWRLYAFLLVMCAISVAAMLYLRVPLYAWAFGLTYLVIVLRDAGAFRRSCRTWPLVREVLDWSKVDQLAQSSR